MNKIIIGIYKITSPIGKVYIGQSKNIKERWGDYKKLTNCKGQTRLYNSFMYYGVESHIFEIIKECEENELDYYERHFQEFYYVIGESGLNCKLTKVGEKKQIISEETRKKQSNAQKKLYESGYVSPMKGKTTNEETRKKQSGAKKKLYEEGYINPHKGKKRSEESRQKMSQNSVKSKQVINIETGEIYKSARELCKILGFNEYTIRGRLNGNSKNKTPFRYL
jgi:group I intron endonuclease